MLTLHDVSGRRIRTLFEARPGAGVHTHPWNSGGLAAGVYWVRLAVDGAPRATLKTLVMR